MKRAFLVFIVLLTACAPPSAGQTPSSPMGLLPYATHTPSPTPERPEGLVVSLETPLPSPTPSVYEVQSGDTLSGIAHKFGVSLDELMALNPDVSPNSMSIGTELKVPAPSARTSAASTSTPAPASVKGITCRPTADSGAWCFVLVSNDLAAPLENLSAQVTLLGADGETLATALALSPLDILPPGASLPLAVFFPPPLPADIRPQAQMLTGILLSMDDARYLPAVVRNTLVQVDGSGRSAQVSGTVRLPAESQPARLVWVAATAYDRAGQTVGVRRWESVDGLAPGGELPFDFLVASAGGEIERVEFVVEARP
ncbi:MAG: LysM peptidoglycan-binding domain-containing protein [Chloroflexota bacterium]